MNARLIKASAYVGNVASVRVFEKNGFEMEHTMEDWSIVPESRGGGQKSIHVLGWRAPSSDLHDPRIFLYRKLLYKAL